MTQPRDTAIPLEILGRATAGLAEAIQVYLQLDGTEFNSDQAFALAQALSLLGQFMSISVGAPTCVPKAFVARVASQLEQAANVSESSTELAAAFRRDAVRLRGLI